MRILKLIVVALIFFTSCNLASKDIETQISDLVKELKSSESLDLEKVSQLVDLYEKFIVENPNSEKTPKYMEMKAKYLTALNKYQEAVDEYGKIYSQFPNYEKRSEALFMQAFIYEVNLNNLVKAEEYYQKYLQEFPDGDLADDARFSLDNLYLSPEQLLEMFRQKSMEDSTDSLSL
jgi:tetratricopeptide (TPR) repeat protein